MKKVTFKNLIKYIGISLPHQCTNSNFKLFNISHLFNINSDNLKIKNIIQVKCEINIIDSKIVKTPKGTSYEGHTLTGTKLFVKGIIKCAIQYNDIDNSNMLHSLQFKIPFIESIDLNKSYFFNSSIISLTSHIIDISVNKLDDKTIYLTLLCYIDANC